MDATDQAALEAWQAAQHIDDDEPAITAPLHPLDAQTVTALLLLIIAMDDRGNVLWGAAIKRLALIAHAILPELGAKSLETIAQSLTKAGITTSRASLSNINTMLYDATGLRRTEKTDNNRESYRIRACQVWQKKSNRYGTTALNQ
ncbi:MAG: hypothetical protein ACOVS5_08955 [Oligoflexus sp.]